MYSIGFRTCCVSFLQATVYLFEKLQVILAKSSDDEIKSGILPMVFTALESNSIQSQVLYFCFSE